MPSSYFNTAGTFIVDVNPLESNGPGNQSTPRQIVDVELLDRSFTTPTDAFVINDDVTSRFVQGFVFTVVGGPYSGSYAVAAPGVLAGDIAAQVVAGQTHIPVVNIVSTAIPYALFAGFTTPNISPTTARNYLVTWQLAGNVAALFVPNSTMQIKRFSYNGVVVNRVYTVVSSTYNGINYTNVVTALYDESVSMPVLGVSASSIVVSPTPANAPLGHVQYTISVSATSLRLIGKGAPQFSNNISWGNALQSNLIHMVEHFANVTAPNYSINGQLWFDTTAGPTAGPSLKVRNSSVWYGVVAAGLPVQGNINMNNFTVAALTNAVTTYPYVASLTGWGNNGQEALNLRTSDALYIAKTGGYNADASVRSGTMTGSLNMTGAAGINLKTGGSGSLVFEATTTGSIDILGSGNINVSAGNINLKAGSAGSLIFEATTTGGISILGSGGVTVATGNIVATAGNVRVGSGTNQVVIQNNASAAPTVVFTTSTTGNNVVNLSNNMLTGLSNAIGVTDAVSLQFADGRYVNVTGDTMTGPLTMSGATANIVMPAADILLGSAGNTVSILNNGTSSSSIVFDTTTALVTIGNSVINLGNNKLTGLSTPTTALDATNKSYVDMFVNGIIWITPVLDPSLFHDTLSAPPTIDIFTQYHKSYIVAGVGTGAWTGFNGHLMTYDGVAWQSILGRAVVAGDRFGVFMEPDNDDPLVNMPAGGLLNQAGKVADVLTVSPYTYTFYTPSEPDAISVKGVPGSAPFQSPHMGHSYTFRGQYGIGAYGTGFKWIEFSGPQMIIDGAGLRYAGNTLNVGAGVGIAVNADDVALAIGNVLSLHNLSTNGIVARTAANTVIARTLTGTASNIVVSNGDGVIADPTFNLAPVTQGAVGTSFVKVTIDGFGRVTNNLAVTTADITGLVDATYINVSGDTMTGSLILNADPIAALGAATKQYVDTNNQVGYQFFVVSTEINTLGTITPGTLYTAGSYVNVPLTGGTGTGATANITVAGGGVTVVTIVVRGIGYTAGDVLSALAANIGGTGSGFSIPVATTRAQLTFTLTLFTYVLGSNRLMIFVNGVKQVLPTNGNYTETSTTVFTFTLGLTVGDQLEAYLI